MQAVVGVAVRPLAACPMRFLPDSSGTVRRVCSQRPVNQQSVQFAKHRNCDARLAQRHGRIHDAIQHPCCHDPHYPSAGLNVHRATSASFLDVSYLEVTPIQGMPTIMDFNFLPDTGRMSASLPSVNLTIYLQEQTLSGGRAAAIRCHLPPHWHRKAQWHRS